MKPGSALHGISLERFSEELSGRRFHELKLHQVLDAHDLELQHRACLTTATLSNMFDRCQFQSTNYEQGVQFST